MFKDFKSRFDMICEDQKSRLENSGFSVGDYVKLVSKDTFTKNKWVQKQGKEFMDRMNKYFDDKLNMRVLEIFGPDVPGAFGAANAVDAFACPKILKVRVEAGPMDLYAGDIFPVPANLVVMVDPVTVRKNNERFIRKAPESLEPTEAKGDGTHSMPKTQVKVPSKSVPNKPEGVKVPIKVK